MNAFLKFISKLILLLLALLFMLEIVFTQIYQHNDQRNKTLAIMNGKPDSYDVIFMGSSRANNHFVPKILEEKGLKSFNYGVSGSHLYETVLMLEIMLERGFKTKNLVLQVDLNLCYDTPSVKHTGQFLPFLHQSTLVSEHLKNQPDYLVWKYIPFYRYIALGEAIGFRETWETFRNKPTNVLQQQGFYALKGQGNKMKNNLTGLHPLAHQASYEKIKKLCQEHHIRFIPVTTPICENTVNRAYFDEVVRMYPEITRMDQTVQEDRYFSSCGHMNATGAEMLTMAIWEKFFKI